MDVNGQYQIVELSEEEAFGVSGGNYNIPAMVIGAFAAGFNFGYYELGPRIFG